MREVGRPVMMRRAMPMAMNMMAFEAQAMDFAVPKMMENQEGGFGGVVEDGD